MRVCELKMLLDIFAGYECNLSGITYATSLRQLQRDKLIERKPDRDIIPDIYTNYVTTPKGDKFVNRLKEIKP